jgi:phage N-6-adenine-methyltransferase
LDEHQQVTEEPPAQVDDTEAMIRQQWRTPPDFIAAVRREFTITLDAAANAANAIVPLHYTEEMDGLTHPWFGDVTAAVAPSRAVVEGVGEGVPGIATSYLSGAVWCNPGFRNLDAWVAKAIAEVRGYPQSVALVMALAAPSTRWWAAAIAAGAEARLLAPRVQFLPPPGIRKSSNARENVLLIFRPQPRGGRPAHVWTWRWKNDGSERG